MEREFVCSLPDSDFAFNSLSDIQPVDQFGFLDLNDCYDRGIVPSAVSLNDEVFNGVSNPGCLISHAQDVFDGLRKAEYVKRSLSALSAAEKEKVEKAVERSVEAAGSVTE